MKFFLYKIKKYLQSIALLFGRQILKATAKEKIFLFYKALQPINFPLIIIGNRNCDGSYILPDDLVGVNHCITFGIGKDISFELDLAQKKKILSTCFDGTIAHLPIKNKCIKFVKKNIAPSNFFLNSLFPRPDYNCDYIDINSAVCKILNNLDEKNDYILKMDIEGNEYKNILDLEERYLERMRILVFEFHFLNQIIYPDKFSIISSCFQKLLKNFYIVSINQTYDNNFIASYGQSFLYTTLEISFLRKDRFKKIKKTQFMESLNFNLDKKVPNKLIHKTLFFDS